MTTKEQEQAARELGIDPKKLDDSGEKESQEAPGQGGEFKPEFEQDGASYEQRFIAKDQYKAPLQQAFLGLSMLRGEHWAMGEDEALSISTAAVNAFPETELPPKLQFISLMMEAIGRRIFIDMTMRPENQEKDVSPGKPDPASVNGTQGGETFG